MLTLLLALVSYTIAAIAIVAITVKGRELYLRIKAGQPDPTRNDRRGYRLATTVHEILSHAKMLKFTGTGIAHWFVMIGFGALIGTLVTAFGQVINPEFTLPLIGHFVGYELFVEAIAWLTGIGIVALIGIRQATRIFRKGRTSRFFGSASWKAYFVEGVIVVIALCVLTLRGLEGALAGVTSWNLHYALSYPIVSVFSSSSLSSLAVAVQVIAAIKIVISMTWFIVIASNLTMGIAWHRFLAPFNIYFKRNAGATPTLGALPVMLSKGKEIDFEDPSEDDLFGLGKTSDISWKGLLDMASCTECGRCQSQCPAWHTDKPLSPKLLIMAMRDHALGKSEWAFNEKQSGEAVVKVGVDEVIVGNSISQEV